MEAVSRDRRVVVATPWDQLDRAIAVAPRATRGGKSETPEAAFPRAEYLTRRIFFACREDAPSSIHDDRIIARASRLPVSIVNSAGR